MQCKWVEAWIGKCKNDADESGFCLDHKSSICASCGEKATHNCKETGQFVCGAPLCDNCQHTIFPDGYNGGVGFNQQDLPEGLKRHSKKTEQKFLPWYKRKNESL